MKFFASDNVSGVDHRILKAISDTNTENSKPYGADPWTDKANELFKKIFGQQSKAYFVYTGTAANVLALKKILKPFEGIICAKTAHINCEECASIENIAGNKLLLVDSYNGKILTSDCEKKLDMLGSVHLCQPKVISVTQSTECGTVYSIDELSKIGEFCKKNNLFLHMDGARLANAAASLGCSLREMTTDVGVDVVSFGGTKNGLMAGEAIVFINPELSINFEYYLKQGFQLGAKMRFISAQFVEYLEKDIWLENAKYANLTAKYIEDGLKNIRNIRLEYPVNVNALFLRMPKSAIEKLQQEFYFYVVDKNSSNNLDDWPLIRIMTSYNTKKEDADQLLERIKELCQ